jgi:flavin-dependent dehydrogenase
MDYDVVIIGGGPAGSTVAALLLKYAPSLRVAIFEREKFPREHVGESHLPAISQILDEMGVWDKVEAANFPIKVGATYRWGSTSDLWHFDFLVDRIFEDAPRPSKFVGQRRETAFQVDRATYDKILLDHARELGADVFEETRVDEVFTEGDRVLGVQVSTDAPIKGRVTARHYVDCSGGSGILRRKVGVGVHSPTNLRNIAIWDYWQDAEWAINIGTGGTRIQVLSLSWGWLWFIPVSETRTSIGLVCPVETFKSKSLSTEDLYLEAIRAEPRISQLVKNARRENLLGATNDWSYVADRLVGENWFLAGDACGFADPILSAGMTLAHTGARRVAYSILDLESRTHDPDWVRREYDAQHRGQIGHHIRFADFWYSSNGCFTDLQENCSEIAKQAGLSLNAEDAFRWLSTGGFANEDQSEARAGTYRFASIKNFTEILTNERFDWKITKFNEFRLNLLGAERSEVSSMRNGVIDSFICYRKGDKTLPLHGMYGIVYRVLMRERDALRVVQLIAHGLKVSTGERSVKPGLAAAYEVLEAMILEGWITPGLNKKRPLLDVIPEVGLDRPDPYEKIPAQSAPA